MHKKLNSLTVKKANNYADPGIKFEISAIKKLLQKLTGALTKKIALILNEAENELKKNEINKNAFGSALERAINLAKESPEFTDIYDSLKTHAERIILWLGPKWVHIINLLDSKELGKKFPVEIVEYDPKWKELYQTEARFLASQFNQDLITKTEHFGSTAVPGLASKPVIDVLVEVSSFKTAKSKITPKLEKLGYIYFWRSDNPPGHMMFVKGYDKQGGKWLRFHLHMAPENHPLWERLLFRDYLIMHPQTAKDYEKLKFQLASLHRNDREAYTDGKGNFIIAVTEKAKQFLK